jgi:hypothetical protein
MEEPPPSLEIPPEAEKYREMGMATAELIRKRIEEIREVEQEFPRDCRGGCKIALEPLAGKLRAFSERLQGLDPLCPASSPEGMALDAWQRDHRLYLQRRMHRVEEAARALARRHEGEAGEAAWAALRREDMRAMVCLSCMQW